jgi:hypothetical protein
MKHDAQKDLDEALDIIESLEAQVERLWDERDAYEKGLHAVRGMAAEARDEVRGTVGAQALTDIMRKCESALDGGGGDDE